MQMICTKKLDRHMEKLRSPWLFHAAERDGGLGMIVPLAPFGWNGRFVQSNQAKPNCMAKVTLTATVDKTITLVQCGITCFSNSEPPSKTL